MVSKWNVRISVVAALVAVASVFFVASMQNTQCASAAAGTCPTGESRSINGALFLGDDANAQNTRGLTVNQLATDDQALTLKSSDLALGTASFLIVHETDDYLGLKKTDVTLGGLDVQVMGANNAAQTTNLRIASVGGQASATKSMSAAAPVMVFVTETDGAAALNPMSANDNILAVQARRAGPSNDTLWILDADGDSWQLGASGYQQSGDPTLISNTAQVYSKDVAGTAELFVRDEAGNVTQVSPHDPASNHWYFQSCNIYSGRCISVDMERLVLALEVVTGQQLMTVTTLAVGQVKDWDADQFRLKTEADAAVAKWLTQPEPKGPRPAAYVPQVRPVWLPAK